MNRATQTAVMLGAFLLSCGAVTGQEFTDEFQAEDCHFRNRGQNPYWVLEPGHVLEYSGVEDGKVITLRITVLNQTKWVDGVRTRVVLEEEWHDGEIVEIAHNWVSICKKTNSVFYFGEDVDIYEDGEIVGHASAWRAGVDGAKPGVLMPGQPLVGSRYYQESGTGLVEDGALRLISFGFPSDDDDDD